MYISDLHIHSRFSCATSKDCDAPHLELSARRKGIQLIGTGDFTHPQWRKELKEQLIPAGEGLYALRDEFRLPGNCAQEHPLFVVTGEISCIYKRNGKTRKVHNLILLPSLEAADELSAKLEAIGNIHSDGRPILGLDSRDLLELTLGTCPEAEFIPAHIWTPHFSMFGAFSDFSTIEECFDDLTPHIHAVETGLSSDPPMNWRISQLDGLTLVSHSDAHSPAKLGREANLMDTPLTYPGMIHAIRTGEGFLGTIEFFPEEGKYHLDGHRNCGVCLTPAETQARGGICPVCGKKLTVGVEHRVEELADRPVGFHPEHAKPFESLAPLPEAIAACTGVSATCKRTATLYEQMLGELGPEFYILRQAPIEDIERVAGPCVAEGIRRLRAGKVERRAGFDGEYGTISLLTPAEIEQFSGQISLFGAEPVKPKAAPAQLKRKTAAKKHDKESLPFTVTLNPEQQEAVEATARRVAVIAGPGTGKTKTLVSRIVHLVRECGVKASDITAVTFTNQAAAEMRQRLEESLGGKRAVAHMTIGTFHAICLNLLGNVRLISPGDALTAAGDALSACGSDPKRAKALVQGVSRVKSGLPFERCGITPEEFDAYCDRLKQLGMLDFDDLLTEALKLDTAGRRNFKYLLVDEFQDINEVQYQLVRAWSNNGNLFVIGDPDQSIYGFRGASGSCFRQLTEDCPDTQVIRLVENYRSAPEVLHASLAVIAHNGGQARILSPNCAPGPAVRLVRAADDFSEAVFVAKEIARLTGGIDMLEAQNIRREDRVHAFSDIAVLCRTHRQLELIEKCLIHDDIPCVISGHGDFLDDGGVRGVLAFFRSLRAPSDTAALETALRLLWEIPSDLIEKACALCRGMDAFDPEGLREEVRGYGPLEVWLDRAAQWLPLVGQEKPWKLIERWVAEYGPSDALDRLKNTAVFYAGLDELENALILGQEADLSRASGKGWKSGAVRLMTLHAAKGLEFPTVFLCGVKSGTLPLESQGRPADIEEERRLFYVGMTRAREELILTTAPEPSPFLDELPDTVTHESARPRKEKAAKQLSLF